MLNGSEDLTEQQKQTLTRKCPFCMKEIPSNALRCNYCGHWVNKDAAGLSPPVSTSLSSPVSTTQQFSNAQPVWHFVLFSILTFGIYEIYWFYRNWKQLKNHKNLVLSPGWRTVGLLVPFYGLYLAYSQFKDIKVFSKAAGVDKDYSPGTILVVWIIINALSRLPDPYWLVTMLSVLPLALVQDVLNSYWGKEQFGLPTRTGFSGGEIAVLIIGCIFLLLLIASFFIPET